MSEYEKLLKLHGAKVTCTLSKMEPVIIKDGKICVEDDKIYVCQNKKDGHIAADKLGYRYSWQIACKDYPDLDHWGCYDLKLVDEELDERLDDLTPGVILEATKTWDNFTKVWNELYHKAEKIKSVSTLEKFTRKVKELV